jgi:hypothetical protein
VARKMSDSKFPDSENQKPQAPEDHHSPGYDNDVPITNWVRSDGTKKPSFDKSQAWRHGKLRND